MTITTRMNPARAAAKADLVYDAEDDVAFPVTCFFRISEKFDPADWSVGEPACWTCHATLIGCQMGSLVLGREDAEAALEGDVANLERVAGEYASDVRNGERAP